MLETCHLIYLIWGYVSAILAVAFALFGLWALLVIARIL